MKVLVKCMYSDGELLNATAMEKAPRRGGNLVIEQWPASHDCRARQARLLDDAAQAPQDVIPPLVEPELVTLKDNRMVLVGYQMHVDIETGLAQEVKQGWVVHLAIFIQPNLA